MDNEFNKDEYQSENITNVNFVLYDSESQKEESVEIPQDEQEATQNTSQVEQTENVTYNYSYVTPTPQKKGKKKSKDTKL